MVYRLLFYSRGPQFNLVDPHCFLTVISPQQADMGGNHRFHQYNYLVFFPTYNCTIEATVIFHTDLFS